MELVYGDRIGRGSILTVGCSGVVFDATRAKVLLTQREDNGQWCVPGGGMDAGESATECCERELWEETGLRVKAIRLIGVYTDPHMIAVYKDGNRRQFVSLFFECSALSGAPGLSNETLAVDWFTLEEALALNILTHHRQRLEDAFASQPAAFVK